jgi:uncharacterized protein
MVLKPGIAVDSREGVGHRLHLYQCSWLLSREVYNHCQSGVGEGLRPTMSRQQLRGTLFASICGCLFSASANSASFDCKTAKHPNEKLICASTELSALDDQMAELFNRVYDLLGSKDRQQIKGTQRDWLKDRLDCDDDFLCTKKAYFERIERLTSVLAKLSSAAKDGGEQCRVSDPNPPLNVRTTPNGSRVGSLPNDTRVVVLDYNDNRSWVFVGRYEDRSPIGWVFAEYIDCRADNDRGDEPPAEVYHCSLTRTFPETHRIDKDPVVSTTVIVSYDDRRKRFLGMEVHHHLQSGIVHKRHEQYSNYRTSADEGGDTASYKWTGVLANNRSISMKGELTVQPDLPMRYTEEMTANGKLDWVSIWSCR